MIRYGYMIDNIVLLITGTLHQRPISELVRWSRTLSFFKSVVLKTDVSDLITFTRLTFSLAGGQVSSSGQLWADGGNPHCQVLELIFLFFPIHIALPCASDITYNFTVLCLCRHHNIQLITFTFCCNLYKTLHKHVIFIRLSLNTFPTGCAFLCPAS